MADGPLHHIIRVRTPDDFDYVRSGLADEILVNANLLEHLPDSTAKAVELSSLPYSIDPLLTRFQLPAWWQNERGETKRNYSRLAAMYTEGTDIRLGSLPLLDAVRRDDDWRMIARNIVNYQRERLFTAQPQVSLFNAPMQPVRPFAPGLVAFGPAEDRVNRVLLEAAADAATEPVRAIVIVPPERLALQIQVDRLIADLPTDGVAAYFLWTPEVSEGRLLDAADLLGGLIRLVAELAARGIPVGHLHGGYSIAALHDVGVAAMAHSLGWVDRGEPAQQNGGGPPSCRTYIPGMRRTLLFDAARALGAELGASDFVDRYCSCTFCSGAFDANQHPLDLLLEEQLITDKRGRSRMTPTGRALGFNRWHYLLARRAEVSAFSATRAVDVVAADIERAYRLGGSDAGQGLRRLASGLGQR